MAKKKIKHEAELLKIAISAGVLYAESRGAAKFEPTDSKELKILYLYRLLVRDKIIQPIPEDKITSQSMRHKLILWMKSQLAEDHPLLN